MADKIDVTSANTAARPGAERAGAQPAQAGPSQPAPGGKGRKGGRSWARALVAALAVVVIAFCAWSMSEYVNGRDPLAFLGTSATQDADAAAQSVADAVSDQDIDETHALSKDDVVAQLASLSWDGRDVSVPADQASVVVSGGNVWVEQASTDGAVDLVDRTAERAAALAAWASGQVDGTPTVTWICEDAQGVVRMVVSYAEVGEGLGDTSALLRQAKGYLISEDTYRALGPVGFDRTSGETPTLPDRMALTVDAAVEKSDSVSGGESKGSETKLVSVKGQPGSGAGAGSSAGSSDGSGSGSAGTPTPGSKATSGPAESSTIIVTVSANGSSRSVTLDEGATALDATRAAFSVTYDTRTGWVWVIDGVGTVDEDNNGWTYTVDGVSPGVMSDKYPVHDGSTVSWKYV